MSRLLYGITFLCQYVISSYGQSGTPTFSQEELRIFASLNLCSHFGGECGAVCPEQFLRHRWGIPLCAGNMECCTRALVPEPSTAAERPMSTVAPPPPHTTATSTTTTVSQPTESCGHVQALERKRKRIVGGSLAQPGSWPWLVGLRSFVGAHACSGALIAQRWVITAAHCFKILSSPTAWRVRLGEHNLLRHDIGERQVAIERIVVHPGYINRSNGNRSLYARYVHDIALIKLSEPAGEEPICLPTNQNQDVAETAQLRQRRSHRGQGRSNPRGHNREACWVAGWGATLDMSVTDQLLREVSGEVLDSQACSSLWGTPLQDDMMCFGNGTYGPCAGDSGGPLSCGSNQGRFHLEGVVSWGTEDCNVSGYPSVFTRVRPYIDWICQVIDA